MEDDQPFHHRPDHPEVFLVGPVLFLVDDRDGGLVRLRIVTGEDLPLERLIQRIQQLDRSLEPAVQRAFREPLQAKVAVLPYLTVERDVILIFLEQDLGEQAGVGDALVDGHQRHGSDLHAFLSLGWELRVVLERVFGADDLLHIEHPRLVLDNAGYLLAYFAVPGKIHALRLYHLGLEHGQILNHFSVLPLLSLFLSGFLL